MKNEWSIGIVLAVVLTATGVDAKLKCGPSKCTAPEVVAQARAAVEAACPVRLRRHGEVVQAVRLPDRESARRHARRHVLPEALPA